MSTASALAAVVTVGALAACAAPAVTPSGEPPVIVIGVDGWEWELTLELIAEGRLPNVARLMDEGTYGELRTFKPAMSPVIWTTVITGTRPKKHGISGFVRGAGEDGGGDESALYTSRDRRVKALWNILSDAGLRSNVVGWWTTYPVEPIEGVMVAQVSTLDPDRLTFDQPRIKGGLVPGLEGQVHPPEREEELLGMLSEVEADLPALVEELTGGEIGRFAPLESRLFEGCTWAIRSDAVYHRVALRLLEEDPRASLLAVYFGGTDVLAHRFWRYTYPDEFRWSPTAEELGRVGGIVRSYYERVDAMIGEIVAAAPEDANVVVLSDHGMRPARVEQRFRADQPLGFILSGQHKDGPPSFFVARGPSVASTGPRPAELRREDIRPRGSIVDVTPTLLAMLGLPSGRDMDGEPMADVLDPGLLRERPVRWIDTHTPEGWRESRPAGPAEVPGTEERIEQLRALGYLD